MKKSAYKLKQSLTEITAKKLAKTLKGGDVVILNGNLGAGKTTMTKFLAQELGFKGKVTSPTYTLLQTYSPIILTGDKKGSMHHLDLYRIGSEQELLGLELDELLSDNLAVTVIEWGDKFPNFFDKYDPKTFLIYK